MVGEELPDPMGREFRTLFNEHNLGAPLETAMRAMCDRIPLLDLRFFSSAVMLQKQTGGNLADILTRLSYVIRERFRLRGQVKATSAHGRMTAMILGGLPVVTVIALYVRCARVSRRNGRGSRWQEADRAARSSDRL